jgi:hypothetical protein
MRKTILKIWDWKDRGIYLPNDRHEYGGIDIAQRVLFQHLFPVGYFHCMEFELFEILLESHGWDYCVSAMPEEEMNPWHFFTGKPMWFV